MYGIIIGPGTTHLFPPASFVLASCLLTMRWMSERSMEEALGDAITPARAWRYTLMLYTKPVTIDLEVRGPGARGEGHEAGDGGEPYEDVLFAGQ